MSQSQTSESLAEAVGKVPFGTMIGWRTPAGNAYGVAVGREGKELLCLTIYDRTLLKDRALRLYRDEAMSKKLGPLMPGVMMDLQRVPANRAFRRGRMRGRALQPYIKAAAHLQLEDDMSRTDEMTERMWIQQAVKRPGRLRKILGVSDEEWEAMGKAEKIKRIKAKLKTSTDKSERGALQLGLRFVGGEFKRRREEDMDLERANALLAQMREAGPYDSPDVEIPEKQLSPQQKALVKLMRGFQRKTFAKGPYGVYAKFKGGGRLSKETLKKIANEPALRWLDVKRDGEIVLGM